MIITEKTKRTNQKKTALFQKMKPVQTIDFINRSLLALIAEVITPASQRTPTIARAAGGHKDINHNTPSRQRGNKKGESMSKVYEAYPLQWPVGYKRTKFPRSSSFRQTPAQVQSFLHDELRRLGATNLIVSSNVMQRKDGLMYSDMMQEKLDDAGVAIYFKYKGKDVSMCCDAYVRPWENLCALGKGIEALRGMERWGVSEFLDRAFTGFKELAGSDHIPSIGWWITLGIPPTATQDEIKTAYRTLAAKYHPDNRDTGNAEKFIQVKAAYDQAIS